MIACNKIRGTRAGLCHTPFATEISRANNDANVVVMGTKVIGVDEMKDLLEIWMSTRFKGGDHQRRIDLIALLEEEF